MVGMLEPRGPAARDAADLWWTALGVGAAVFLAVLFVVAVAVVRGRRRAPSADRSDAPPWTNLLIVVTGGVGTTLILVAVFGFSVATMRRTASGAPPGALVIDIVGHRWWWEVRYENEGIVSANEAHVPTGQPVVLRLKSADVIHSFWVPPISGKMDLLPERLNTLVATVDEPGEYRGVCAEFCGLQHARHQFVLIAQEPAQFAAWVETARRPAPPPTSDQAIEGQRVFAAAGCGSCHTISGTDAVGTNGPDLTHIASRRTFGAGLLRNEPDALARFITGVQQLKTGALMPAVDLDPAALAVLVTYLQTRT